MPDTSIQSLGITLSWVMRAECIPDDYPDDSVWDVIMALKGHDALFIRCAAIRRADFPERLFPQVLEADSPPMLASAAGKENTPREIFEAALMSDSWSPRLMACGNPHVPEALVLERMNSFGWAEKVALIQNRTMLCVVLNRLAKDGIESKHTDTQEIRMWALARLHGQ